MKYHIIILAFLAACVSQKQLPQTKTENEPSSEIPAVREFKIDSNVNPCDDFYAHACGPVMRSFRLRDDRSYHDFAFNDSSERLLVEKKKFLAGLAKETKLSARGEQLRKSYLACMNESASKKEEVEMVQSFVKKVNSIKTREEFLDFLGENIIGVDSAFIGFDSVASPENPDVNDLLLVGHLHDLPEKDYYDNPDLIKEYEDVIAKTFVAIGWTDSAHPPEQTAKEVVRLEKEFVQIYPKPEEWRELYVQKKFASKEVMFRRFGNLKLQYLFDKMPSKIRVRDMAPKTLEFVNKALVKENLYLLKSLYLRMQVTDYMDDAYPDVYNKRFAFDHKFLGGPAKRSERDERCSQMVAHRFSKELDAEMVDRLFPNFPVKRFVGLTEKIRAAIIKGLEENQWLSKQGKEGAIRKMKTARLQLVKPQNDEEWDFLPVANYQENARYQNYRTYQKVSTAKRIEELHKKRNRNIWGMSPLTVNAYYSPDDNKFVMPIGILQPPFFDPQLSDEANMGAVGMVTAHELGHGLDDKGSQFNEKGELKEWLPQKDREEFAKRTQNMIAQFDRIGHNGKLTLGENIADLVGLSFAHKAAFGEGVPTTKMEQEFYYQFARVWCYVAREKAKENALKTDSHSLGEARVNEQVKHQDGFQRAFLCKPSDKMVLQDRVRVW